MLADFGETDGRDQTDVRDLTTQLSTGLFGALSLSALQFDPHQPCITYFAAYNRPFEKMCIVSPTWIETLNGPLSVTLTASGPRFLMSISQGAP